MNTVILILLLLSVAFISFMFGSYYGYNRVLRDINGLINQMVDMTKK